MRSFINFVLLLVLSITSAGCGATLTTSTPDTVLATPSYVQVVGNAHIMHVANFGLVSAEEIADSVEGAGYKIVSACLTSKVYDTDGPVCGCRQMIGQDGEWLCHVRHIRIAVASVTGPTSY